MTAAKAHIPRTVLALLLLLRLGAGAEAQSRPPHTLVADVNLLSRSTAPYVVDRWVVFTYRPEAPARFVALRFAHEQYSVLHPLELNEKRIFVLLYRPPEGVDQLTYRMSVDGLWMRDPANPLYTTDVYGATYSLVDVSSVPAETELQPVRRADGRITFTLRDRPGELVSIAGSFNRWDPFVHVLEEVERGVYRLTLRLPPGVYYYYYLTGGRKTLDPANPDRRRGQEGDLVNLFTVP